MTAAVESITPESVCHYVDRGYLALRGVFSADDLNAIKGELIRFARGEYKTINKSALAEGASDDEALQALLAVHFPHWVSPVIRSFVDHPALAPILQRITAAHLPDWDGSVKCMQTMLFAKGPGMPGQAWHQDERFIPTRDRSLIGTWIAVDDATIDNGCLWVIPGSHRHGYLWPVAPHDQPDEFDPSDEAHGFEADAAVPVEVEAGSVVFFNGYLLHRSFRNRTDNYRRALVNHYCNAWSLLPWAAIPFDLNSSTVGMSDFRNIVPIGADPYAWKGYEDPPDWVFVRPRDTWGPRPDAR